MTELDKKLQALREKVARKQKLENAKAALYEQRGALREKVEALDAIRIKEQADVDKLENRSLANFFYNVIGKMDEQLDREREEAYAAAVKYDAALRELEDVQYDLESCLREYAALAGVEAEYLKALQDKTAMLKAAGGAEAEEILHQEQMITVWKSRKKEIYEAKVAGSQALNAAQAALQSVKKASGYATWDLLGGGLLADMAKYDALDRAQGEIEHLQRMLRRFHTELTDVSINAGIAVNVEGFTRTADYIFDGLFVDWMVSDQIGQSKEQVTQVVSQIERALSQLETRETEAECAIRDARHKIDQLVLKN